MKALEATARAFATFSAAYPSSKKIDEATVRFWSDELRGFTGETIESAAHRWVRTERFFPNLPNFIVVCREERPDKERLSPKPECGVCDDGWVEVDAEGRGTVERCPNGCQPAGMSEPVDFAKSGPARPDVFDKARSMLVKPPEPKKRVEEPAETIS